MKIGISGVTGKMGLELVKEITLNSLTDVVYGLTKKNDTNINKDVGLLAGVKKIDVKASSEIKELFDKSDVIIDFSSPESLISCAQMAAKTGKTLISGTTGLTESDKKELHSCASSCTIVYSANMSIGVNLLFNLCEEVAGILHEDYDAEVLEMHHRNKVDAPSGTALHLGEAIARGRNLDFGEVSRKTREGIIGKRGRDEVGFACLRGGDVIGDHTVIFAGIGERIELSHKASNRNIYARGALRAAIWASDKKNGLYSMQDVLSVKK